MKRLVATLFSGLITIVVFAQKEKTSAELYIEKYKELAIAEMQRTGVPAAITLAQGLLESGYGKSDLCVQSNNHFGIKCKNEWTGAKVYHDDDTKNECFRSYPSAEDSYKDHSDFLRNRPNYDFLFKLNPTNYEAWAKGLKRAGYATEKDYSQKLIKVINDYRLNQYTYLALNKVPNNNDLAENSSQSVQDTVLNELIISVSSKKLKESQQKVQEVDNDDDSVVIINNNNGLKKGSKDSVRLSYPEGIFTINHTKVIFAKEGTSLLLLANQHNISLNKLLEFNDMDDEDVLTANKLIFLEKKMSKGASDFHIVEAGEKLYDISQKEGVRLDKLEEYNHVKKEQTIAVGTKIYLRSIAPPASKTMASNRP